MKDHNFQHNKESEDYNSKLRKITREEIKSHNMEDDLWVVIKNKVYDLSKFVKKHPGGKKVINNVAGQDATEKWFEAGHSHKAQVMMNDYLIGEVPENERYSEEVNLNNGVFSNYVPVISFSIFCFLFIFSIKYVKENLIFESKSDIFPFIFGVFPSVFLILSAMNLWFGYTFRVHRIGGLFFLILYSSSWYYFLTDYNWFKNSFLVWSLLLMGNIQAISAIITIGPTLKVKDSGEYFSSKGQTVSLEFITENWYYQILTAFSSLYYYPYFFNLLHNNPIGKVIEVVFVFLPFVLIRTLFPKTTLRDATKNNSDISTNDHRLFFLISNWAIKFTVIFGKHYVGLFTNAVRFIGGFNDESTEKLLQFMMLANSGTVTISTFLHTLKFKNQLSPKVAMSVYLMFLYTPAIAISQLFSSWFEYPKMLTIFTIGAILNFTSKKIQFTWYILLAIMFVCYDQGIYSETIRSIIL